MLPIYYYIFFIFIIAVVIILLVWNSNIHTNPKYRSLLSLLSALTIMFSSFAIILQVYTFNASQTDDQIKIFVGDQANRGFLRELREEIGHIDIVIDDGGHTMIQQITTFEELFPFISETGIYLVEDLHTSYWKEYGGGYLRNGSFIEYIRKIIDGIINSWHSRDLKMLLKILTGYWEEYKGGYPRNGSFIEYAKGFIDSINAWHSRDPKLAPNHLTKSITGIHFYDSVLVIEKYPNNSKPKASRTGNKSF